MRIVKTTVGVVRLVNLAPDVIAQAYHLGRYSVSYNGFYDMLSKSKAGYN